MLQPRAASCRRKSSRKPHQVSQGSSRRLLDAPGQLAKGGMIAAPESPLGGHVHICKQLGSWPLSQISTAQANAHASGDQEDAETEE